MPRKRTGWEVTYCVVLNNIIIVRNLTYNHALSAALMLGGNHQVKEHIGDLIVE